jgi:hypothetical protein
LIIDEYDKLGDRQKTNELMANTIKSLSDYGVNVTVILVGVADNINDLMGKHESLGRCVEQIPMPRMNITERREILQKIVPRLGMKLQDDAMWKIVHLSRGLPSYVHSLGLYSVESAIRRRSLRARLSADGTTLFPTCKWIDFRFLNLSRCDPHDMDRVAGHIGGPLLAFGASGHNQSDLNNGFV